MPAGRSTIVIALLAAVLSVPFPSARAAKPFNGAEYRTKEALLYGRFEVRMKSTGREGTVASFFTYNDNFPTTPWNEIDIEILGRYSDDVQFNTITPGQANHVSHQYVGFDPAREFHVYAIEWTPAYVAWFIDSVEVYRQTAAHIATLNLPQKLMMNVWNPVYSSWVGTWNSAVLPAFAVYDWVSVASYTPGTGSTGTGNNFTMQWRDDFDSWDQTRWEKSSHTWDGNNCDLIPANAVFKDGTLILCLTDATAPGYVDGTPPGLLWARVEGDTIRVQFSEDIEKSSAETVSNYILTKGLITGATLMGDLKTVLLRAPGIDTTTVSNIIVRNVRDTWSVPNAMPPSVATLLRSPRLAFPLKINVGGTATLGYLADQDWSPAVEYGRVDGQTGYYAGVTIAGAADEEIYRSETSGLCEYKVRVPNGRYAVVLMMAENRITQSGLRSMNIWADGKKVESALDVYSIVGFRAAYGRLTVVDVTDNILEIHFQALIDSPFLNGLTITPISTGVNENSPMGFQPGMLRILGTYPNPFNGGTTISFVLPRADRVTLRIFDILGESVDVRAVGEFPQGPSSIIWNPRDSHGAVLPSGAYFCVVEGSTGSQVQKVMYLK